MQTNLETRPHVSRSYQTQPFGLDRWPEARRLLLQEYPQTDAAWWEAGLQRMRNVPPNAEDLPLGMLLLGPLGVSGVMLLIASRRYAESREVLRINGSSWAIVPHARGQVLRMAQACLVPGAITTALTSTPAALRVQQRVGFVAISHQRVLVITPRLAWHSTFRATKARVLDAQQTLDALREQEVVRTLIDHLRLGCLVCAIETPDAVLPLVLRPRKQSRVIPLAELIYTPSLVATLAAISPLTRHLMGLGFPLLEFEANEDAVFDIPCTRLFRRRFAHGPYASGGIDHLYSEMVYLHAK